MSISRSPGAERGSGEWGVNPIDAEASRTHDQAMALFSRTATVPRSVLRSSGLQRRRQPRLRVRLRVAWCAADLDEALADGADPLASDELTLRATKLVDPAKRAELVRTLELVVSHVSAGGPSPFPGPTILRRQPIARNRPELLALAWRLRIEGVHCLRGLAMADRMIRYDDSPLYMALGPLQLRHGIEETLAALEPDWDGQPADMPHRDSP